MTLPTNLGDWPIQLALVAVFMIFIWYMWREFIGFLKPLANDIKTEIVLIRTQIAEMEKNHREERDALLKIYIQLNQDVRRELGDKIDALAEVVKTEIAEISHNKKARS